MCLLPERLEQTAIRDIVFRKSGGMRHPPQGQKTGFIRAQANQIVTTQQWCDEQWSVRCLLVSRGDNSSLFTAWWHKRPTVMWFSGCFTFTYPVKTVLCISVVAAASLFTSSTLLIHRGGQHLITHTNLFFDYSLVIVVLRNILRFQSSIINQVNQTVSLLICTNWHNRKPGSDINGSISYWNVLCMLISIRFSVWIISQTYSIIGVMIYVI